MCYSCSTYMYLKGDDVKWRGSLFNDVSRESGGTVGEKHWNIVVNVHHCHLHIGLATPVGVSIVHVHSTPVGVSIVHVHSTPVGVSIVHVHSTPVGVSIVHVHSTPVGVSIVHVHSTPVGVV